MEIKVRVEEGAYREIVDLMDGAEVFCFGYDYDQERQEIVSFCLGIRKDERELFLKGLGEGDYFLLIRNGDQEKVERVPQVFWYWLRDVVDRLNIESKRKVLRKVRLVLE